MMRLIMIKTILVPASGSATDDRVFSTALSIARPMNAHLEFFHVRLTACEAAVRSRHLEFCSDPAINDALHDLERDQGTSSRTVVDHVKAFCSANGVAFGTAPRVTRAVTAELTEETDQAESRILAHARHSDLLVLGRPAHTDLIQYDLIERLLLGSGRPLVIASDSLPVQTSGTVVVAWQETPAAARAVSASLPLLQHAKRVVLLNVAEPGNDTSNDLDLVAKQLSWHGVLADTRYLSSESKSLSEALLQTAAELDPELLVVGGYSHWPLHETFFGGVTITLLNHAKTPIFMMH